MNEAVAHSILYIWLWSSMYAEVCVLFYCFWLWVQIFGCFTGSASSKLGCARHKIYLNIRTVYSMYGYVEVCMHKSVHYFIACASVPRYSAASPTRQDLNLEVPYIKYVWPYVQYIVYTAMFKYVCKSMRFTLSPLTRAHPPRQPEDLKQNEHQGPEPWASHRNWPTAFC